MLKKRTICLAAILAVIIVQISVLPVFFPGSYIPQLALMLVIAGTIIFGFNGMLPWILAGGIIMDLVSYQRIGSSIVLFVLVSYFVSFFSRRFLVENKVWGFLVMIFFVVASTLFQRFYLFLSSFTGNGWKLGFGNPEKFLNSLPAAVAFNIILFFIIFLLLRKEEKISFLKPM